MKQETLSVKELQSILGGSDIYYLGVKPKPQAPGHGRLLPVVPKPVLL